MDERLGDRIRGLRDRVGMPGAKLARRVHVTRQQLYMIETHKTLDPGILTIEAIADEFGVTTDYLLKGTPKYPKHRGALGDSAPTMPGMVTQTV